MESHKASDEIRLGLALSGGGLRAAFFHIGLLAQLADADLLRRISVLSTVSGGSIVGAAYYLKARRLLETQGKQSCRAAFQHLVSELEEEFLAVAQRNLRMSTFANAHANARMIRRENSSTEYLAQLLDKLLYAPLTNGSAEVRMSDLTGPAGSRPSLELIINATTLNRGSLFQFTSSGIGEALPTYDAAEDTNLVWLEYDQGSLEAVQRKRLERLTLGQAVGASCSVPGLFDALILEGLFRDPNGYNIDMSLVDGGVFDNQGLTSLLRSGCTHVIGSDATDVLRATHQPSTTLLNTAMRANEILMDRVRGKVLSDLSQLGEARSLVITASDPRGDKLFPDDGPRICRALANIRTDLDSFSDCEAKSLMDYGYRLGGLLLPEFELAPTEQGHVESPTGVWRFLEVQSLHDDPILRAQLIRHLEVGSKQFLKVFWLGRPLPWILILLPLVPPVMLMVLIVSLLPPLPWWVWVGVIAAALSALAYTQNARLTALIDRSRVLRRQRLRLARALTPLGVSSVLGWLGAVASRIHLLVFDRLFLNYGRIDNVTASAKARGGRR